MAEGQPKISIGPDQMTAGLANQYLRSRLEKAEGLIRELKSRLEHHKNDCEDCRCPGKKSEYFMLEQATAFLEGK